MKADRLAGIEMANERFASEEIWWNRVSNENLDDEESDLWPLSFIKKYGTFATKWVEFEQIVKTEQSMDFEKRFDQIKNLEELQTDQKKQEIQDNIELRWNK